MSEDKQPKMDLVGVETEINPMIADTIQTLLALGGLLNIPMASIVVYKNKHNTITCDAFCQPLDAHFFREMIGTLLASAVEDFRNTDHHCKHTALIENTLAFWIKESRRLGFKDPSPPKVINGVQDGH